MKNKANNPHPFAFPDKDKPPGKGGTCVKTIIFLGLCVSIPVSIVFCSRLASSLQIVASSTASAFLKLIFLDTYNSVIKSRSFKNTKLLFYKKHT